MEIISKIPIANKGPVISVQIVELMNWILYKLKTVVQWEFLPVSSLFIDRVLHPKTVFGHYRNWCKKDVWKESWTSLLSRHKSKLDLSSGNLDSSHTTALKGVEQIGYRGRKKRKTTNALYFTDRQGLLITMSEPISGNHNDLFDIEVHFEEVTAALEQAEISLDGLFLNVDPRFDCIELRQQFDTKGIIANFKENKRNTKNTTNDHYFDGELYKERYAIERTNAWIDCIRTLLNRFDTTASSWKGFNYLAFMVIGIGKFQKNNSRGVLYVF